MKYFPRIPLRTFSVGRSRQISINDVGCARLEPDELLTFITDEERRYDLVRKNWGFYATPSLNGRLVEEGFRAVLVKNA